MKKNVIVLVSVLLCILLGALVSLLMNDGHNSSTNNHSERGEQSRETSNPSPNDNIGTTTPYVGEVVNHLSTALSDSTTYSTNKPTNSSQTGGKNEPTKAGTNETPKPLSNLYEQDEPSNGIEVIIQQHKNDIEAEDLADFRRIYQNVDLGYIQSLLRDSLTVDETTELKDYLKNTLNGDYERAKELFYKYSYILTID